MASPFHYFRKHQKQCFAILTVFIVFVFVVGSALQGNNRGDSDRGQQVVATWNGGEMTAEKLGMLVRNRRITSQFLRGVVGRGIEAGCEVVDIGLPTDLTNALVVDSLVQHEQREGLVL